MSTPKRSFSILAMLAMLVSTSVGCTTQYRVRGTDLRQALSHRTRNYTMPAWDGDRSTRIHMTHYRGTVGSPAGEFVIVKMSDSRRVLGIWGGVTMALGALPLIAWILISVERKPDIEMSAIGAGGIALTGAGYVMLFSAETRRGPERPRAAGAPARSD